MKYRIFFLLALTIFCGLGAGVFTTFNENSLVGTLLFIFFPFMVVLFHLEIAYDLMHELKGKQTSGGSLNQPVKAKAHYSRHHPTAA